MQKYIRFLFGVKKYLNDRTNPQEALINANKTLKERVEHREENFLNLVEKGIYGYAKSPYLALLESKKIELSDVKKWTEAEGIEKTLMKLQSDGIYYTVDEFKGKKEVVRNGLRFTLNEKAFDNPFLSAAYEVRSGATRSAGTRIRIDFDYLVQRCLYDAFILNLHGSLTSPIANWFPVFPGAPGINSSLRFTRIGNPPKKWFSQVEKAQIKVNWEKRWGVDYIFFMSRRLGIPLAEPEYVSLNNAYEIAKWASEVLQSHPNCVIYTFASSAVRVCMAAQEHNLNIEGTRFLVTGEPLTAQKKREITATGSIAVPVYGISEAGVIATGCSQDYSESDHCHTLKDTIAITSYEENAPFTDSMVNSLLFTSILFESPKLLLNVGMGDSGIIESNSCACEYGKLGFDTHVSRIRSFEKMTGEGVTFVDTDFMQIIEKDLPQKYGGQSTDYQLIEEEDNRGLTSLKLLISPRLKEVDEKAVASTFIDLLKKGEKSPESWSQSGSEMWSQAGTINVKKEYPIPTRSGKILPFYMMK
jgi:hypothetical protein